MQRIEYLSLSSPMVLSSTPGMMNSNNTEVYSCTKSSAEEATDEFDCPSAEDEWLLPCDIMSGQFDRVLFRRHDQACGKRFRLGEIAERLRV